MFGSLERKRILALNAPTDCATLIGRDIDIRFCDSVAEASEIADGWKPSALCIHVDHSANTAVGILRACKWLVSLHDVPAIAVVSDGQADWPKLLESGFVSLIRAPIQAPANRAILNAIGSTAVQSRDPELLVFHDLRMNLAEYKVWRGDHRLDVPAQQFELLKLFMLNPGRVFSKEELVAHVWEERPIDLHTVNTACMRLRRAICSNGGSNLIRNVHGRGYALDNP